MFCFFLAGLITSESRNPAVCFILPLMRNLPNTKYPLQRTYCPSIGYTSTELSSGIRPLRNNRISIIFCSFYKNLLFIHQSLPLPCTKQGDLQAQCSCAILPSLCWAVNGSLHHRTGPYCPRSHSQNSTTHLEKAKWSFSVPHPEAIWHHKVHIYLRGSGHSPSVFHLSQTAANISCCRRNTQWSAVE